MEPRLRRWTTTETRVPRKRRTVNLMRTSRGGERVEAVGSLKSRARRSARRHFVMRVALRVLLLALAVGPCIAGGDRDAAAQSADFASRAETFDVPASQRVEVFPPANYDSTAVGDARPPLLVFLHGFCLPDANQQAYNFTAVRANAGGGRLPRRQTLSQVGLREVVDERGFVYATPMAPHHTRKCARNLGDASPNVADQLTTTWINQTMSRVAPAFACPAWDGSDACCNPELGGEGDDARFLEKTVEALLDAYAIDPNRVYLVGIATGGFMANRMACERPDLFAASSRSRAACGTTRRGAPRPPAPPRTFSTSTARPISPSPSKAASTSRACAFHPPSEPSRRSRTRSRATRRRRETIRVSTSGRFANRTR